MATSQENIVIGVSGAKLGSPSVRAIMLLLRELGATVIYLGHDEEFPARAAARDCEAVDGIILMGNDLDIDPAAYIHRYPEGDARRCVHPSTQSEQNCPQGKRRAAYEFALLEAALPARVPLLGICGGMQRINIACGGTLHQHIPELVGCERHMQKKQGIDPHIPVLPICIKPETTLAQIAQEVEIPFLKDQHESCPRVIMENAMHHQAVDVVGEALRVNAITDSVILERGRYGFMVQGIEADPEGEYGQQFLLGVQWHPEFRASPLGQRIALRLLEEARLHAQKR